MNPILPLIAMHRVGSPTFVRRAVQLSPRRHNSSFAFSGSGWLTPFYFGVLDTLMSQAAGEGKLISEDTLFAGSSGGALASLVAFAKMSPEYALEEMIKISTHRDVYTKVDKLLRASIHKMVTDTFTAQEIGELIKQVAHNNAENKKLLNICITRVYPQPSIHPVIINTFDSLGTYTCHFLLLLVQSTITVGSA